jgi:ATP-dependent Clp protease adapter protein ClpS
MAPDLVDLVDAARELARRSHHEAVGPDHLLLALLASTPTGLGLMSKRGICIPKLTLAVEQRLANARQSVGYRGTVLREEELEALFVRAEERRPWWRRSFRPLTIVEVAAVLVDSNELAPLVDAAMFDVSAIRALAANAAAEATKRRHRNVLAEHALLALCEDASFREPLTAAGVDVSALRKAFTRMLRSRRFVSAKLAAVESHVTIACLRANVQRSEVATVGPIVVGLLRSPHVARSLGTADFDAFDLLFAYVHGRALTDDAAPESAQVEVVFYDDGHTTMDHVVATLKLAFGLDAAAARSLMLKVHEHGEGSLGVFEAADGTARVKRARELARKAGMPLRAALREA